MLISRCLAAVLAGVFLALGTAHAQGGTIRIGAMSAQNNQYVVPIVLSGGDNQVAALNFRLQYDPAVFRPIAAESGAAAAQANKVVTANSPAPGDYIVVMMGLNQSTVPQGEVARVVMERLSTPESGQSELVIHDSTLATPEGIELPSRGMRRTVDFNGVEPSPREEEPETPDRPDQAEHEAPETPEPAEAPAPAPEDVEPSRPQVPGQGMPQIAGANAPEIPLEVRQRSEASAPGSQAPRINTPGENLSEMIAEAAALRADLNAPTGGSDGLAGGTEAPEPDRNETTRQADSLRESDNALAENHLAKLNPSGVPPTSLAGTGPNAAPPADSGNLLIYGVAAIFVLASTVFVVVRSKRLG